MLNDALASSHFAIAGKLTGNDAIVVRGACRRAVGPAGRRRRRAAGARGRPLGPLGRRGRGAAARAARQGVARRLDRPGGRAPGQVRDRLARRPPRRPRRPRRRARLQAHQGDRGARPRRRSRPPTRTAVLAAARDLRERSFGPATAKYRELGTLANLLAFNAIATLPTRNFQAATFAEAPRLAAEDLAEARGSRARQLRLVLDRLRAHLQARRAASRAASSTRTCSRSARCAASRIPTPCSRPAAAATSSASTPSPPAGRSPGRWSARSAA